MTKNVSKDDAGGAANEQSTRRAARDENAVVTGGRGQKTDAREPLHARIVHFEADRSAGPLPSDNED